MLGAVGHDQADPRRLAQHRAAIVLEELEEENKDYTFQNKVDKIGFTKEFIKLPEDSIVNLKIFKEMAYPLLIGPSRKAFIGDVLKLPPEERVEGTIATVVAGILNGANIVRVHDVKENKRAILVTEKILASK